MKNKFYITTAIPYVNGDPHVGFAMELTQADVLARWHRQGGEDVFFVNGTDENALKNVQAAEKAGKPVSEFVNEHAQKFIKLSEVLNISNDDFIRTTEERHIEAAQKIWQLCEARGDIYKKKYKGLYCVGCEEFKTVKDLVDGHCPEHHIQPEEIEEENYFFRLSKYQKDLENLIDVDDLKIIPESRKNEARQFIRQGLEDFSISRSNARAKDWGVSVPGDDSQKIFVWFDALINYLSALDFTRGRELYQKFWLENDQRCHLIGKGINRFHTIYWPAMLLSAGIKPPSTVYVHGYLNIEGQKISKSLGNIIDPFVLVEKYGVDPVRYFLLREIPSDEDGDFSEKKLVDRYNGDLANGLGNLVQRVVTLIESGLDGELIYNSSIIEKDLINSVKKVQQKYEQSVNNFKLHDALSSLWDLIGVANVYINDKKPWALVRDNPEEFLKVITNSTFILCRIWGFLKPFLPDTADRIRKTFGADEIISRIDGYKFLVKKGEPLFPRIS